MGTSELRSGGVCLSGCTCWGAYIGMRPSGYAHRDAPVGVRPRQGSYFSLSTSDSLVLIRFRRLVEYSG